MKMRQVVGVLALVGVGIFLNSCSRQTIPEKAKAVQNFEKKKYLGKWYEIARLDFKFERAE
jgi:apolipoprotein D and lipocalin family protein